MTILCLTIQAILRSGTLKFWFHPTNMVINKQIYQLGKKLRVVKHAHARWVIHRTHPPTLHCLFNKPQPHPQSPHSLPQLPQLLLPLPRSPFVVLSQWCVLSLVKLFRCMLRAENHPPPTKARTLQVAHCCLHYPQSSASTPNLVIPVVDPSQPQPANRRMAHYELWASVKIYESRHKSITNNNRKQTRKETEWKGKRNEWRKEREQICQLVGYAVNLSQLGWISISFTLKGYRLRELTYSDYE